LRWSRGTAISACVVHSLVATSDGAAYSFGHGNSGRLGHGDTARQPSPRRIGGLRSEHISAVAAGARHSLALSSGGSVFSFGWGVCGQLGHGDKRSRLVPERICGALAAVRAVAVSAGCEHSLVLAAGGAVYSFGYGSHGRLGHGDEEERLEPQPIASLGGGRTVGAGQYGLAAYSVASTASGDAFAFGCGEDDALGVGARSENLLRPRRYPHLRLAGEGRTEESPRECC